VRLDGVAGDALDLAARLLERRIGVAEIRALLRTAGRVVLGIEIQDERLAARDGESERAAAGGRKAELADRLADCFQVALRLF